MTSLHAWWHQRWRIALTLYIGLGVAACNTHNNHHGTRPRGTVKT
jgi:hypothetical protein